MNHFVIAIDGQAASGKGTLSRKLSQHLSAAYLDTGKLYRAVGLIVIENPNLNPEQAAQHFMDNFDPDILAYDRLGDDDVGQAASKISTQQAVRDILFNFQRDFASKPGDAYKGAVLDGRDIGTVICPDADVKLFIEADIEIRAERRTKELQSKGITVTYEAVLQDMRERDARDASRQAAPMVAAPDALKIDTSLLSPDEVFDKALEFIAEKLEHSQ